jgi:Protein of unknown function (DUF1499)
MGRSIGIGVLLIVMALIVAALGLRWFLQRADEDRLRPDEDVAIAALRGPLPGNAFLACPPGYCRIAGATASPVVAVDADRLYWALMRVVTAAPRVTVVSDDPRRRRIVLIQRSPFFGFPDIVVAEIVALGAGRSSVALYSRARHGRYDFGVNRRRVEGWLGRLAAAIRRAAPSVPRPAAPPGGG